MVFLELIWVFSKIGAVTFGGGYAMISLFLKEVVSRGWVTPEEFANIVAVAQVTPGPIAMNTATYVGKLVAGVPGAFVASFALVIPPVIYISLLFKLSNIVRESAFMKPIIRGIRAASIGLISTAVLFFGKHSIYTGGSFSLPAIGIFIIILIAVGRFKLPLILAMILSITLGITLLSF